MSQKVHRKVPGNIYACIFPLLLPLNSNPGGNVFEPRLTGGEDVAEAVEFAFAPHTFAFFPGAMFKKKFPFHIPGLYANKMLAEMASRVALVWLSNSFEIFKPMEYNLRIWISVKQSENIYIDPIWPVKEVTWPGSAKFPDELPTRGFLISPENRGKDNDCLLKWSFNMIETSLLDRKVAALCENAKKYHSSPRMGCFLFTSLTVSTIVSITTTLDCMFSDESLCVSSTRE